MAVNSVKIILGIALATNERNLYNSLLSSQPSMPEFEVARINQSRPVHSTLELSLLYACVEFNTGLAEQIIYFARTLKYMLGVSDQVCSYIL